MTELSELGAAVAVVTGGTGVLGSEIALGLAAAGARVGVLGRNRERADALVERITGTGGEAITLIADVLEPEALRGALRSVQGRWGEVDILVNAAGGHVPGALTSEPRSFFEL